MNKKLLSEKVAARIKARHTIGRQDDPWLVAYYTKGGSYIVASNGKQSDSGMPRDLVLVLPDDRVIPMWFAVNPQLIEEIEEALA